MEAAARRGAVEHRSSELLDRRINSLRYTAQHQMGPMTVHRGDDTECTGYRSFGLQGRGAALGVSTTQHAKRSWPVAA